MRAPITDKHLLEMMWERFPEIMKRGVEQPAHQCKWPTCQSEEYQQALAQEIKRELVGEQPAQQEPVAWGNFKEDGTLVGLSQHPEDQANWTGRKPLYTSSQRTWVGLTDEDKQKIELSAGITEDDDGHIVSKMFELTEAKLKERNQ